MNRELDFRFEDFVDDSIDKIRSGQVTVEECIALHPEWADELRSVLSAAVTFGVARPASADEKFKADLRSKLVAMAETRQQTVIIPAAAKAGILNRLSSLWTNSRYSFAAATMAVLLLAGGTGYAASVHSLPGSPLYALKIAGERASVNFSVNHAKKTRHYLRQAELRLGELKALSGTGKNGRGWATELANAATSADRQALHIVKSDPAAAEATRIDFENSFTRQRALFGSVAVDIPEPVRSDLAEIIGATVPSSEGTGDTSDSGGAGGASGSSGANTSGAQGAKTTDESPQTGGSGPVDSGQNKDDGVSDQKDPDGTGNTIPGDTGDGGTGTIDPGAETGGGNDTAGDSGGGDTTGGDNANGDNQGGNNGDGGGVTGDDNSGGGNTSNKDQGEKDLRADAKDRDHGNHGKEAKPRRSNDRHDHPAVKGDNGPKKDTDAPKNGGGAGSKNGGGAGPKSDNNTGPKKDTDAAKQRGDDGPKNSGGAPKNDGGKGQAGDAEDKSKSDKGKSNPDKGKSAGGNKGKSAGGAGGGSKAGSTSGTDDDSGGEATWVKEKHRKSVGSKETLLDKLLSHLKFISAPRQKGR